MVGLHPALNFRYRHSKTHLDFAGRIRSTLKILTFLFLLLDNRLTLSAAEVTATLNPTSVPAGEGAQLTITISNGEVTALTAPEVPGLILNGPNQGRQVSIINGVRTTVMSLSYAAGSMSAGEYNIPAFLLTVDGSEIQTNALKLTVTPSASQTPAGLPPNNGGTTASSSAPTNSEGDFGFLTVEFAGKERKHAWVGEIAPVRIKAWLPAESRVSVNTPLQPKGSSFTLHNLSPQPRQEMEESHGKRYLTVTWYGGLSATKAGSYPPDLSMKITLQVPDTAPRRQRSNDPIFDQFFARMVSKEVELRSKTDPDSYLEIRALPNDKKPENFAGAVGKFAFGRFNIPSHWKTGEPQQIGVEVEGEGNFNLLRQPTLTSEKSWKSYEGKSSFVAKDAASFSGTSTYQFSQVPRQSGTESVTLNFSYFDPDLATYQSATTASQTVEVSGSDLPPELPTSTLPATPNPTPSPPALAPQRDREGVTINLIPLAWRSSFRQFLTLIILALGAGFSLKILRHHRLNPQRLARKASKRALHLAVKKASGLATQGDVSGFFATARHALQVHLAELWHRPASAITLADVTLRLPADSPIISFFQEADRQEFSPTPALPITPLSSWQQRLEQTLSGSSS